jgi:TonB family protein
MVNQMVRILIGVVLVAGAVISNVRADSWALPQKKKYYSQAKKYYLEVVPKKLESQLSYFEDKAAGKENAGAPSGVKDNRAKGAFYARRSDGTYAKKWEFPLVNEVAPVSALVSNKGTYFVTFDNWHSVGHGEDVVAIYRQNGTLIKKFGLQDLLTKGDIETLPHSVSSIWWGGEHYIDEEKDLLILKIVANRKSPWQEDAEFHELKIELASGQPLEPKRDLFPQSRVSSAVDAGPAPDSPGASPGKPRCSSNEESFDSPEFRSHPSPQLYARVKTHPLPPYPAIAKAAHAEGSVIVELLVSKSGEVICARSLSGHPLLQGAALAAILNWKFDPIEISGEPAKVRSTVAFNFTIRE